MLKAEVTAIRQGVPWKKDITLVVCWGVLLAAILLFLFMTIAVVLFGAGAELGLGG